MADPLGFFFAANFFLTAAFFAGLFFAADFFEAPFRAFPAAMSWSAFLRVAGDALPFFGGGTSFPARRAFDNPIAIACFSFFNFPAFAACISSRISSLAPFVLALRPEVFFVAIRSLPSPAWTPVAAVCVVRGAGTRHNKVGYSKVNVSSVIGDICIWLFN